MSDTLGPIDHIARVPLPWRAGSGLTECGKTQAEVDGRLVPRAEIETRIRQIGKQRAAFTTCMTCASTSSRWTRADQTAQAILAVGREAQAVAQANRPRESHMVSGTVYTPERTFTESHWVTASQREHDLWARKQRLAAELEAISALIEAHREEFEGYLSGLDETVSLADRRTAKRRAGGVR